ncbi:MAG TPA: cyclase family protein [Myxococcales bacterium]|nr:cyclase family protein [Myxococcales bacterium]HIL80330.1 cyclase family protein [Myxococcales bacterium]
MSEASDLEISREWLEAAFEKAKNWGRWGDADEAGALNFITPAIRARAAQLVTEGRNVSCALPFPTVPAPDNPHPALHHMIQAGDSCTGGMTGELEASMDFIGIAFHGMATSHIDALCHVFVNETMYNGRSASEVKSTGAQSNAITVARDGIVSRGVLLDIPRLQGVESLELGYQIGPGELEAAEKAQGVTVGEGDILLVATGRDVRRARHGAWSPMDGMAGLGASCVPWLHERRIAVLGSDGISDSIPSTDMADWSVPIHQCCLVAMGVHLLDNLKLSDLAVTCAEEQRWEFLFTIAPLVIEGGTGCPVNPVAMF